MILHAGPANWTTMLDHHPIGPPLDRNTCKDLHWAVNVGIKGDLHGIPVYFCNHAEHAVTLAVLGEYFTPHNMRVSHPTYFSTVIVVALR
jgi:hypothetical protein